MKRVTISASVNRGGVKVPVGSKEVDKPETLAEAKALNFKDEDILAGFWKSYVIDVQASIRSGVEASEFEKQFKQLPPEKQAALMAMLEKLNGDSTDAS